MTGTRDIPAGGMERGSEVIEERDAGDGWVIDGTGVHRRLLRRRGRRLAAIRFDDRACRYRWACGRVDGSASRQGWADTVDGAKAAVAQAGDWTPRRRCYPVRHAGEAAAARLDAASGRV